MFHARYLTLILTVVCPMYTAGQVTGDSYLNEIVWEDDFGGNGLDLTKWNLPVVTGDAQAEIDGEGNLVLSAGKFGSSVRLSNRRWFEADSGFIEIRFRTTSPHNSRLELYIRNSSVADSSISDKSDILAVIGQENELNTRIVENVYETYGVRWNPAGYAIEHEGLIISEKARNSPSRREADYLLLKLQNHDATTGVAHTAIDYIRVYRQHPDG